MTPKQYKEALAAIGMSQVKFGPWLKRGRRTSQRWAETGPPEEVAKLLRLMVRLGLKPEDVK